MVIPKRVIPFLKILPADQYKLVKKQLGQDPFSCKRTGPKACIQHRLDRSVARRYGCRPAGQLSTTCPAPPGRQGPYACMNNPAGRACGDPVASCVGGREHGVRLPPGSHLPVAHAAPLHICPRDNRMCDVADRCMRSTTYTRATDIHACMHACEC